MLVLKEYTKRVKNSVVCAGCAIGAGLIFAAKKLLKCARILVTYARRFGSAITSLE
jgi:hypothetical protein